MSYHDGEYGNSSKKYPEKTPSHLQPCICREEYEDKGEIDPICRRCNHFK
ncbi:hypothetical protein J2S74_002914 [Evansella vedderi]|uniref:Uncharacterized protein n=1 Tax=Evansella vedderi TaxID=38282 RepID=A0ABT9ZWC2_9BACI|nr:hypothetical protein [Evansella vedderi]MDQ0255532.1 hypothetical protein [Evansella vedderi]